MNTSARLLCFELYVFEHSLAVSTHFSKTGPVGLSDQFLYHYLLFVHFLRIFWVVLVKMNVFFNGSRIHSVSNLTAKARRNTTARNVHLSKYLVNFKSTNKNFTLFGNSITAFAFSELGKKIPAS